MMLPETLQPLFHRYKADQLETEKHALIIIPTVLQFGDWNQIHWLFQTYGWDYIKSWISDETQVQGLLSPIVEWFWTLVLLGKPRQVQNWTTGNRLRSVPPESLPDWWPSSDLDTLS
ncbi:MAG: hypothetical protein M1294_11380 [Firmicutes bacterium]|jgi:hypothetical protein|nr:hypothetical protein [Bacillota bacterium]MCL5013457.1 hypothetical protein [Bacillota bacterium]HBQ96456.1 hypothetical protein [Sulfobacillus sp.]